MPEGVFIEVLVFVSCIQMTILPLFLINTTPLNYRGEVVFSSSRVHSSCPFVNQVTFFKGVFTLLNLNVLVVNLLDFASWAKSLFFMLLGQTCLAASEAQSLFACSERSWFSFFALKVLKTNFCIEVSCSTPKFRGCIFYRSQIPNKSRASSASIWM